jgi:hypothetical protein
MLTAIPTLDRLLQAHALALGGDFTAYHNHGYRVANACVALSSETADVVEKIAIASALHDIGIWTNGTFDYLEPSTAHAVAHLERTGRSEWVPEVSAMIRDHHKVTPSRRREDWLVEPFRQADWIDVTYGLRRFGLSRAFVQDLYGRWPDAGFHRRLVQLSFGRVRTNPLSPLPMFRW